MVDTKERPPTNTGTTTRGPVARRPLRSRVALGHVLMVVAGLVSFVMATVILRERSEQVRIAVVAHEVQAGVPLSPADLDEVALPAGDGTLATHLIAGDELALVTSGDQVAARTLPEGTLLGRSDVRARGRDDGARGMSVAVPSHRAAGGSLVVGDIVDVVVVRSGLASYAAAGLRVIAVSVGGSGLGSSDQLTLTVAVDGATSLRLASALSHGDVHVVRATSSPPVDDADVYRPVAGAGA